MKLALLSDLHANLQAFEACIAHARAAGATQFALLGDFVGYGGDPGAVVDRVMRLVDAGAFAVRGNHDALAVLPPVAAQTLGESSAAWTHAQLDATQHAFLDALPLMRTHEDCLLVHASAHAPERWLYVDDARSAAQSLRAALDAHPQTRFIFGGHVHRQSLYYRGAGAELMAFAPTPGVVLPVPRHRHWVATVGSVGQPRDGDARAMYALFDTQRAKLVFQRVRYDVAAAVRAIDRAGVDAYSSQRLVAGR
ncbi:MAG TPA: metallophosphoesterase family protein [Patescibacteria group bacterium]|nr:metallophosphoesterase family protein [Patescibacteria group bacterium]